MMAARFGKPMPLFFISFVSFFFPLSRLLADVTVEVDGRSVIHKDLIAPQGRGLMRAVAWPVEVPATTKQGAQRVDDAS